MLKQITASLIYPEGETGKKFWKHIYEQAAQKFGTTNIPVNTFNKVWIVPDKAVVYDMGDSALIGDTHLKVMLEEDYLAIQKHNSLPLEGRAREGVMRSRYVIPHFERTTPIPTFPLPGGRGIYAATAAL